MNSELKGIGHPMWAALLTVSINGFAQAEPPGMEFPDIVASA